MSMRPTGPIQLFSKAYLRKYETPISTATMPMRFSHWAPIFDSRLGGGAAGVRAGIGAAGATGLGEAGGAGGRGAAAKVGAAGGAAAGAGLPRPAACSSVYSRAVSW